MPEKKTSKHAKCNCKDCHCAEEAMQHAFPVCLLACILTATLVALCFAISIAVSARYQYESQYAVKFSGKFAEETNAASSSDIRTLTAGGVIDFYEQEETGFIYASSTECPECMLFEMHLSEIAKEVGVVDKVFHYHYPANADNYDRYAQSITIASDDGPVLLYIRDGRIYDRLDEPNSELAIRSFLLKYK
jgi:hypothetical protein